MPVKEKLGVVVSNKMQKTIVVKIENRYPHPIYSKTMLKTKHIKYINSYFFLKSQAERFTVLLYHLKMI